MTRLVLASASPRRKALLSDLGIRVDVVPSNVEEHFDGSPDAMVVSNARNKRDDVAGWLERGDTTSTIVIAADTLVFLEEHVLGKPRNLEEAAEMLRRLSGRTHEVLTGLALREINSGIAAEGSERTAVTFRNLTKREIEQFVMAVEPLDRAGAYTVDGPGSLLVERYDGCYQNVLGLPVVRLDKLFREIGYSLFDLMDSARARFL